jgi:D-3-phosphoglycerate dehydrogenase
MIADTSKPVGDHILNVAEQPNPIVIVVDGELHPFYSFERERDMWTTKGIDLMLAGCQTEEDLLALETKGDVLVYWGLNVPFTRRVIESQGRCRLIARYGTGVDSVDVDAATEAGIPVAVPAGYCTEEVALHATALLLALARRIVFLDRVITDGGWRAPAPLTDTVQRLSAQTLGLVGFGRIAQRVAENMRPMVGRILCSDPYVDSDDALSRGVQPVPLEELLEESDLISVHVPLTPETTGLIGRSEIDRIKSDAFLVNTSRGPVIDEMALAEALQTGSIAGAGLDVFIDEPLPSHSPLRGVDNVVLTPHFASSSEEAKEDMFVGVGEIVEDALAGRWPAGVVNPSVNPRHPLTR